MRVYLDNCCYNRPFDSQSQPEVVIETLAKLAIQQIQQQMRSKIIEYVWSEVLDFEICQSPFVDRNRQILPWANGAVLNVGLDEAIRVRAKEFEKIGVRSMDALHLACAERASCDWFFTTDKGILNKAKRIALLKVANPMEHWGDLIWK